MKYFLMPKKVFNNTEIGMYGIVILSILSKYANRNNECFPSRRTIAAQGGFSIATYNKYIIRLLISGVVQKMSRWRQNMSQTSNLFKICRKKKDCFRVRSDIFQKGLSTKALCVYLCLCRYVAEDNCCRVSQRIIARDCSMSLVSVICAVDELRKSGFLDTLRQTNISNNGNYVLLYRLLDGRQHKNVIHKSLTLNHLTLCNKVIDDVQRNAYVIDKRLNNDRIALKSIPIKITYSPYANYIPPELYLY